MSINAARATDFSAQKVSTHPAPVLIAVTRFRGANTSDFVQIHVLPLLWLTASLSLGLKIPEAMHSLLIPHPQPQRDISPLSHSSSVHHNIPSSSSSSPSQPRSLSPSSPRKAGSSKMGRTRSTMTEARQGEKCQQMKETEVEMKVREAQSEVKREDKEESIKGWLGSAAQA